MRHKQSETGRIFPKSFLKTAIFSNKTTKNGDFWKLYVYEIGVSLEYISVKCRKTDTNPTEKCENTVENSVQYYTIIHCFSTPKCVKYSRNFQNKMYEFYKIPKCVIKSVYTVYIFMMKYTTQTLLQLLSVKHSVKHLFNSYFFTRIINLL